MKNGWRTKTLGDVAEVIAGQSPEGSFYNTSGEGLPFYQGKKEFGERFIGTPTTWTSQTTKVALEGDVLMSVRAPVGPVNFATEKSCIGRGLAAIRSSSSLDRNFLFYFLLSKQAEISGTEGAVFASINKTDIQKIEIAVPTLSEQRRIVTTLDDAFDGIAIAKTNAEKNHRNARALFESHLQSVFIRRGVRWMEKNLAEISKKFGRGKSKHRPRNDPKLYGGKYPFIQTGDVRNSNHLITSYSQSYNEAGLAQSKLWPKGTLCITIAANIAETGILDFDACFPDSVIGVVVNDDMTSNKFLEYLLQSFKARLQAQGKAADRRLRSDPSQHQASGSRGQGVGRIADRGRRSGQGLRGEDGNPFRLCHQRSGCLRH
jgi:type I restriction enzyme S subunit